MIKYEQGFRYNGKFWECVYCKKKVKRTYVATGHDHTDYSIWSCDCELGRKPSS